ncbi:MULTISPECIES: ATP-binding protein [unclassified Shewanella]|uniref:ATP-binding protein n=1 Tax=unclassified Shewanella TaxID=196818 RepID=UPI000C84DA40|nr:MULTISPECIES: ATP-binding protein [unclassified Shewanella]MDO6619576.1 ATP-binding protein [Shewanella sp. 6_MG-2023]MDO6641194.1 ATP-binding protein [Shewanella sp. 5_MG-2023]MDO6679492.1 ATP-binding protein [Shewanella sp. 4_MG-2023]MDO6775871.1 ATP-binding protein [Shewanella sp. 3_MG-2023]PMG29775.1 hypothetical protein BCU94_12680 [Shewanella sp. 10N.286.52.C2]
MNNTQLNISINSMTADQVYDELEQFLISNKVEPLQRFKLISCALEATNNVQQHSADDAEDIKLLLQKNDNKLIIDILDNSNFTPLAPPSTCPNKHKANGRGLWIMHQWMDQVQQQATVLGTHLRLSINLG